MFRADSGFGHFVWQTWHFVKLAIAAWVAIKAIWWVQDRIAEFRAARKAKAAARVGHAGKPVVQGKLPKGTFQ